MNWLVNILTGISLISGLASIIFSLELHVTFACWAIILSFLLDGLKQVLGGKYRYYALQWLRLSFCRKLPYLRSF
ncbi:MAG: hypothetical protein NTW64_06535 [Candidatus Omnitrophica bacterium]|nr:hypothetical protein [Candidatus Omnitrophota bacterium]